MDTGEEDLVMADKYIIKLITLEGGIICHEEIELVLWD